MVLRTISQLNEIHQIIVGSAGSGLFNLGLEKYVDVEYDLERILTSCRYGVGLVRRLQYFTGVTWEESEEKRVFNLSHADYGKPLN